MIVAVPSISGTAVEPHMANARAFTIARVEDGAVAEVALVDWTQAEIEEAALVAFLGERGVEVVLAGSMGYALQQALKSAGFTVYTGISGEVAAALEAFLRDDIEPAAPGIRPLHGPPWAR
jgi:predicted Fe-Mo cluster-binding NifX family protein